MRWCHAKERKVGGVICGQFHAAAIRDVSGLTYTNRGDWVDSCTAIVEHVDGEMELIQWQQGPVPDKDPTQETRADVIASEASDKVTATSGGY